MLALYIGHRAACSLNIDIGICRWKTHIGRPLFHVTRETELPHASLYIFPVQFFTSDGLMIYEQ